MLKDYVLRVNDNSAYLLSLREQVEAGLGWCVIDENDEVKVTFSHSMIRHNGILTVSISRLTPEQYDWYISLLQVQMIGQAKVQYIKNISDITFQPNGKTAYHQVHNQIPKDYTDIKGVTYTVTPPVLHCILAS